MSKYIGYRGVSNEGYEFKVTGKGSKSRYFVVRFENGYEVEVFCSDVKNGAIKNPYHPSVYGVGYFGVGDFVSKFSGKNTKEYDLWRAMLQRCYSDAWQAKHPTYIGCSVAPEWHNFQNFASWITGHENWKKGYHLDKDLKVLGNKVYSDETCDLIPSQINTLLLDSAASRGNCAIGVYFDNHYEKYVARCRIQEGFSIYNKNLGRFETEAEAFFAYKQAKEETVKRVADTYKDEICEEIYINLMNWEVAVPNYFKE